MDTNMNTVKLTDDELSLILTSLRTTLTTYDNHISILGKGSFDYGSLKVLDEMKILRKKIEGSYKMDSNLFKGSYIGLQAIDGTDIKEGDIVEGSLQGNRFTVNGVIVYHRESAVFGVLPLGQTDTKNGFPILSPQLRVVGSIYDKDSQPST